MSVRYPEVLLIVLIVGLHIKYMLLWSGKGGLKGFWSGWDNDSNLKKLCKVSLVGAVTLAFLGVATTHAMPIFLGALFLLAVHLLTLIGLPTFGE